MFLPLAQIDVTELLSQDDFVAACLQDNIFDHKKISYEDFYDAIASDTLLKNEQP